MKALYLLRVVFASPCYSTLSLLYISSASRFQNFLSRCVLHYPTGLLSCMVSIIMIRLTTIVDFGPINWPVLVLALLITNVSICAFAQFLGIFSIVFTEWLNTLAFSLSLCFILTGGVFPLEVLPKALQEVGKLLPMTNGLLAIRAAFKGAPLGVMAAWVLACYVTSLKVFRWE